MPLMLVPHPTTPPAGTPFEMWVNVDYAGQFGRQATLNLWFGVRAPIGRFVVPQSESPGRRDGLWNSSCMEAFLQPEGEDPYREWNFAPSGDWAAYDFEDYRTGMTEAEVPAPPYVRIEDNLGWWTLGATVALPAQKRWKLGLSAVLEERDGTKSYWALAHPEGPPDFHDPACFIAQLPLIGGA